MECSTAVSGCKLTAALAFQKSTAPPHQSLLSVRALHFSTPSIATSPICSETNRFQKHANCLRKTNATHSFQRGTYIDSKKLWTSKRRQSDRISCRLDASQEALPAPPESWPIDPPLEKVEHERYMYPADTLPGYVKHSKDPRMPVKVKTSHLHVRGAVGCRLCHWMGDICSQLKLDGWVKELDDHNMEIVVSGPSTAIDWLVGTCYRHPPDAKVFQVVESPYYEPIEKGFRVYEIDRDWVQGGHEEMRGTATFDFFGEETMEMLWDVMWQDRDRLMRGVLAERAQEEERAKAEAAAELDRRLREREEQQGGDYTHSMLVRAMQEEGTEPTLDDLTARSFRTIEAERVRKASVAPGGLYSIDDDDTADLLEAGAMSEEELYEEDGMTTGGSDDDDSTLQALIDSIAKSKQPAAKRTPRRRGARSAAAEEEGSGNLGDADGGTRVDRRSKRAVAARKRTAVGGSSETDDSDDFFADLTAAPQEPLDGADGGAADVSGAAAAAAAAAAAPKPPPKPRGRPRKVKTDAEAAGVAPSAAAPKAKRGRRKQAAAQSVEEPAETSDFG